MVEQEIIFRGQTLLYRVNFNRRRKRQSSIQIRPDGRILVDVPVTTSLLQIRHWVNERADWLLRRRAEIEDGQGFIQPLYYVENEQHLFLGKPYHLKLFNPGHIALRQGVSAQSVYIRAARTDPETAKARLWCWYRDQARSVFQQRLSDLSEIVPWVNVVPEMKLRKMRRRWGSCTSQGLITLNTHLVKAPPGLIDYVILHELCHLREHNHSRRFYHLMDQVLPQWRELKQNLDDKSELIANE